MGEDRLDTRIVQAELCGFGDVPFIEQQLPWSTEGMVCLRYMVFDVCWGAELVTGTSGLRESAVCSVLSGFILRVMNPHCNDKSDGGYWHDKWLGSPTQGTGY